MWPVEANAVSTMSGNEEMLQDSGLLPDPKMAIGDGNRALLRPCDVLKSHASPCAGRSLALVE